MNQIISFSNSSHNLHAGSKDWLGLGSMQIYSIVAHWFWSLLIFTAHFGLQKGLALDWNPIQVSDR